MRNQTIAVIDYEAGNIASVLSALSKLGYHKAVLTSDEKSIHNADAIILPGVGAFDACIGSLKRKGLDDILNSAVIAKGIPILGICVGMQLMANKSSENGEYAGLGWINAEVVRLEPIPVASVPQVGWNDLQIKRVEPLFETLPPAPHFYFDHSYHFSCPPEYITATVNYGGEITAAVQQKNITGVQFHPEKSQRNGLKLLRAFCEAA